LCPTVTRFWLIRGVCSPMHHVDGWPLRRAAERFNVSVPTAARWSRRYRELGEVGLQDRRSRPPTCPHRTRVRTERRVLGLRVNRQWGPARIAYHLHLNVSTVHRILVRYLCPPLRFTDPATGIRIRGPNPARRYEYAWPGEMIHVDVKKLGRIPNGGGHRIHGRVQGEANARARNLTEGRTRDRGQVRGYTFLHHALDDHSRFVYSEILPDETKEAASAFMRKRHRRVRRPGRQDPEGPDRQRLLLPLPCLRSCPGRIRDQAQTH